MIKRTLISSVMTVSLTLLLQTTSIAGVYKWVDENGQVHYGERPGNTEAERITIRQNETTKPRTIKTDEKEADKKEDAVAEKEEPEEPKISKKEKRKLCNEAKSAITAISNRGRMREINDKGEYIYLSEKQRQQRLSAARKKQRKYCR